jgi:hypothetical protein
VTAARRRPPARRRRPAWRSARRRRPARPWRAPPGRPAASPAGEQVAALHLLAAPVPAGRDAAQLQAVLVEPLADQHPAAPFGLDALAGGRGGRLAASNAVQRRQSSRGPPAPPRPGGRTRGWARWRRAPPCSPWCGRTPSGSRGAPETGRRRAGAAPARPGTPPAAGRGRRPVAAGWRARWQLLPAGVMVSEA